MITIAVPAPGVQAPWDIALTVLPLLVTTLAYLFLTFSAEPYCKLTVYVIAVFLKYLTQTSLSTGFFSNMQIPRTQDQLNQNHL